MNCPKCDQHARIVDSRDYIERTRRRRYVCRCGVRFRTLEHILDMDDPKEPKPHWQTGIPRWQTRIAAWNEGREAAMRAKVAAEIRAELLEVLDGKQRDTG